MGFTAEEATEMSGRLNNGGEWPAVDICMISVSIYDILGGGNSQIFYFHPYLGKIPNLTIIFFRGVETTN